MPRRWADSRGLPPALSLETTVTIGVLGTIFLLVQITLPFLLFYEPSLPGEGVRRHRLRTPGPAMRSSTPFAEIVPDPPRVVIEVAKEAANWGRDLGVFAVFARLNPVSAWMRGTAHIDWCEGNYEVTRFIAEFFNTWSNLPFFLGPPIAIYKFRPFSVHVDAGINFVFVLLMCVGAGSGYFHATLTLSGQLFDEWSILWVIMTGFALWMPRPIHLYLGFRNRRTLKLATFGLAVVGSYIGLLVPAANAFLLLLFAVPGFAVVYRELQEQPETHRHIRRLRRLFFATVVWWVLALVCWINDRLFCEVWKDFAAEFGFSYPQLHALWHVFVYIACYISCTLAAFFFARRETPHLDPGISYWPSKDVEFGLPYVEIHVLPAN